MTQPTIPATEHRHVGGSAGGPGENSAECACGTVFDGFDTHREAKKLLDQHIKDETKAKPVALLESGDWIDLTSLNDDYIEGPALVRYVETYEDISYRRPYTMVVFSGGQDPQPSSYRWPAEKLARLLTGAEIEQVKAEERREKLARQFEQLAEMARRSDVPFPDSDILQFTLKTRAEVEAVGTALGLAPTARWGDGLQVSWPKGQQTYDDGLYVCWHTSEKAPVEPELVLDPERGHVPADDLGYGYSREEDPTPVSPARGGPVHTGAVVAGGELVDETPAEAGPAPLLLTAAGLTPEADLSRGPLAGTTPVVAYFSFGYGQTDPDSGQRLLDHYVTVVAPTYEECRTAMFASRYGNRWSWDYLAGRPKTTEAVSGWTEHEVIVADGTDQELAKSALKAAGDLLYGVPVSEARWHECEDPAGCGESGGHQAPEPTFPDQPVGGF